MNHRLFILGLLLVFNPFGVSALELEREMEQYFSQVQDEFDEISSSPILRSNKLSTTNTYFIKVLRKAPHIRTVLRVNSKGMVVNEVTRGQKPLKKPYRMVDRQRWFVELKEGQKPFYGFKKIKGQPYLFWANPLYLTTKSGEIKFTGAVVAKIDLKGQLFEFAQIFQKPFYLKGLGGDLLHYKWDENRAKVSKKVSFLEKTRFRLYYSLAEEGEEETRVPEKAELVEK